MRKFALHERDFEMLRDEYAGFCAKCCGITRDGGVEPDARNYPCIVCETRSVMGMEEALLNGLITIEPDPEETDDE